MKTAALIAEIESHLASPAEDGVHLVIQGTVELLRNPAALNTHAGMVVFAAGIAAEATGEMSHPVSFYQTITGLDCAPDHLKAKAWYRLAVCYDRLGNWGKSMNCLRQALRFSDDLPYIRHAASYRLGLLLTTAEEYQEASEWLQTVLSVADHPEVNATRATLEYASCLIRLGRLQEAEAQLQTIRPDCDPDSGLAVQVRLLLVEVYHARGDRKAIEAPLRELATLPDVDPQFRSMAYSRLLTLHNLNLASD